MTNKAMNIHVQVFVWMQVFTFVGSIPASGMAGSYGSHRLDFLRNCQTIFPSGCTIFHFHRQSMRAPAAVRSLQRLEWSVVILDILIGVLCYLTVIFISISLVTNDTEHLFMWLLTNCISLV